MIMKSRFIIFSLLPLLTSCAYYTETSLQDISVATPGAVNAECIMTVNGFQYVVEPPQTINITKSKEQMVLSCQAPGNRQRLVYVDPVLSQNFGPGAIATGGLGGAVDYFSGAAFRYPDVIEVDFTKIALRPEPLPEHNAADIRAPESYLLEEYLPGDPRLNSDRFRTRTEIRRRQKSTQRSVLSSGYNDEGYSDDQPAFIEGEMSDVEFNLDNEASAAEVLDPSGALPVSEDMSEPQGESVSESPAAPAQMAPVTSDPAVDLGPPPGPSDVVPADSSNELPEKP